MRGLGQLDGDQTRYIELNKVTGMHFHESNAF